MLSPSPTQQPPNAPHSTVPEKKDIPDTPARQQPGQSPTARFLKSIFRPILKAIYYTLRAIRGHFRLALAVLLLLVISISATNYFVSGQLPFGVGNDQFNYHVRGGDGGGEHVKNWLYALREGNVTTMNLIESETIMNPPPDAQKLVDSLSQSKAHLAWKSIIVTGVYSQSDTSVDSFVSIDFVGAGPGGVNKGTMIWHFTTLPSAQGRILFIHLVDLRPALQ